MIRNALFCKRELRFKLSDPPTDEGPAPVGTREELDGATEILGLAG
jgi:hypothetical protein